MALMPPDQASTAPPAGETIEELFAALESPLLGYALRLLGDAGQAEDLVQEAFMKLHSQFDLVREPRRWLYRTIHNLALNQRRQDRKIVNLSRVAGPNSSSNAGGADGPIGNRPSPIENLPDADPLPDEHIARWENIGLVRLSLESLDERSRQLVRLKFNDELSYKEISARTGLTVGHVGYLLHHALRAVADELTKHGVVP